MDTSDTHGDYLLVRGLYDGQYMIRRRDEPNRTRPVAFLDSRDQWPLFTAAIDAGQSEVEAVHAIDDPRPPCPDPTTKED